MSEINDKGSENVSIWIRRNPCLTCTKKQLHPKFAGSGKALIPPGTAIPWEQTNCYVNHALCELHVRWFKEMPPWSNPIKTA